MNCFLLRLNGTHLNSTARFKVLRRTRYGCNITSPSKLNVENQEAVHVNQFLKKKKRKRKKIHIQTVTTSKVARFKSTPGSRLRSPCDSGLRGPPTPEERDILSPSPLSALCMNLCPSLIYIHIHSQQLSADMCACFLVFFPSKSFQDRMTATYPAPPNQTKKGG